MRGTICPVFIKETQNEYISAPFPRIPPCLGVLFLIRITTTAVTTLRNFLDTNGFPTDVTELGAQELREFILHLQQVKAFERYPFTKPQDYPQTPPTIALPVFN